jgi:hypothetical protein
VELERRARKYQGEAFRAYLTKRTADKGATAALKAYMAEYIADAPLPNQQRWLARIQRLFAGDYAGAAQAIDYGILPWSKKATLRAIKVCMYDAMDQLIAASAEASELGARSEQSDQSLLAEFKRRVERATFVRIKPNRRKNGRSLMRLKKADGVVRPTKSGKVEYLLFGRRWRRRTSASPQNRVLRITHKARNKRSLALHTRRGGDHGERSGLPSA